MFDRFILGLPKDCPFILGLRNCWLRFGFPNYWLAAAWLKKLILFLKILRISIKTASIMILEAKLQ